MFGLQIGGNPEIPADMACSYGLELLFQMIFQLFILYEWLPYLSLNVFEWLEVEELERKAKVAE